MSSSTKKSVQLVFFKASRRAMAPNRRRVVGGRHLVCGNCASWIQHENSGCEKKWADTRVEGFVFTCKGCTDVAALAKEVEGLRQMVEYMKEVVAGLHVEDKGAETGSGVTTTGVNQDREEATGKIRTEEMITGVDDEGEIRTEEMITGVEDEGEIRTEERKEICAGSTLMVTHAYTRNPESPLGKEIDLQQWNTLIFKGEHAENEHWRLVEDRHGQVGYAPAAFLMVILDTTVEEEEESSATKKGQENSTEENQIGGWVGQEGERRKSYSAAVIDGIKRNSRIYVGDSIVRKTDTRLSKGEDVVVCLPGARIEQVTERVEQIMGRGNGGSILVHIGTNNADKEGTAILEKYRNLLKKTKEERVGHIILPVFGNRIQGYRNSKRMSVNGMVKRLCKERKWDTWICGTALWGKKKCTQEMACILVEREPQCLPRDCQGR